MTTIPLNESQVELLKLFARSHQSEDSVKRLRRVLFNYLMESAIDGADRVWEERGYTTETVEGWKHEHMRIQSSPAKIAGTTEVTKRAE